MMFRFIALLLLAATVGKTHLARSVSHALPAARQAPPRLVIYDDTTVHAKPLFHHPQAKKSVEPVRAHVQPVKKLPWPHPLCPLCMAVISEINKTISNPKTVSTQ